MGATSPCLLRLRERIRSLQSAGIDKIWMTVMTVSGDGDFTMANVLVSGDGDFTMANVLGFFNADLILLLKTEPCWQCRPSEPWCWQAEIF